MKDNKQNLSNETAESVAGGKESDWANFQYDVFLKFLKRTGRLNSLGSLCDAYVRAMSPEEFYEDAKNWDVSKKDLEFLRKGFLGYNENADV